MTLTFVVECPATAAEMVSDRLWGLGVMAITEEGVREDRVRLRSSLGEDRQDIARRLQAALAEVADDVQIDFEEIDDGVTETWRLFAQPVQVLPDLVIVPAWLPRPAPVPGTTVVGIEPGSTFGLGDHPTTRASLVALRRHLRPGGSILDVGCGSGVLGICALCCGARSATGLDINPSAAAVSQENARRNGVADAWSVAISDLDDTRSALLADRQPGGFDLVVANILAPVLLIMAPHLVGLLASDGALVVSGVLQNHYDHVSAALAPLREIDRIDIDGWSAVVFGHDTKESISSR